jgi:hypothetical protein
VRERGKVQVVNLGPRRNAAVVRRSFCCVSEIERSGRMVVSPGCFVLELRRETKSLYLVVTWQTVPKASKSTSKMKPRIRSKLAANLGKVSPSALE